MDDRKYLYDTLSKRGVNLGPYEEYDKNISDPNKAKWLYDKLTSDGINLGTYNEYMRHLGHNIAEENASESRPKNASQPSASEQQSDSVYAGMTGAQMMRGAGRGAQNASGGMQNTSSRTVNPVTGQVSGGGSIATNRDPDVQSAGNIDINREEREAAEAERRKLMRDYMEQTGQIDRIKQLRDEAQQRLESNPNRVSWADRALGLTNIYHGTLNAWKDLKNLFINQDVAADERIVKQAENALEAIDEAGYADKGFWSKQVGGVLRGVGNAATDSDTWDFGVGGISEGKAIYNIMKKQKMGEELSQSEQGLLTMMGLKSYVDDAYGEEAGMGYKVGASLPQSAGFMVQMYLNPLSGLGKKAGEYFGKAAIKHFANQGKKKLVEKLLINGTKVGARVLGDAVEQAGTTLIPGAGRVYEDYLNRSNGQVDYTLDEEGNIQYLQNYGQEEDAATAMAKALGSNYIENWSEAVGEYFKPIKKGAGSLAKYGVEKVNSKRLNKLYDWVMNTKKSDFVTAMDKFKQKTKYDGLVGEYMEEVVGNVTNALTVKDNNFSLDPDSKEWKNSVFNPEMNAETFLSCALMSGTMRAVEGGVNYGQRRYINNRLNDWENRASSLLGDAWSGAKAFVDNAEPSDVAAWLDTIRATAKSETDEKRKAQLYEEIKAVHNYAFYRAMYQAYNARRLKEEESMTPGQKQEEAAAEMQGQAEDVNTTRTDLNGAAAELEEANSQLRQNLEEMLVNGNTDGEVNNIIGQLSEREQQLARAYVDAWKNAQRAEENSAEIQQQKQDEQAEREEAQYEQERTQRRDAYREYKLRQMQLASELGENNTQRIATAESTEQLEQLIDGYTPEQKNAARAFWSSARVVQPIFTEMQQSVERVEEEARQQAERDYTTLSNTDSGELVQVTATGIEGPSYVTSGRLAFGQDEDGKTVVLPSESDDMVTLIDEKGNAQMTTPAMIQTVESRSTKEQYMQDAVDAELNDAMSRFEAELETPDIPRPEQGGRFTLTDDGRQYVIAGMENGAVRAYRLTEDATKIDEVNPNEVVLPIRDYYDMKARELWNGYGDSATSPATSEELQAGSDSETSGQGEQNQGEPPLPKLEDGTTDFDALFDQSVGRFYNEYAREFGSEEANNALAAKRDSYYKEAEKIRKKAEKAGSFNERSALNRQAAELKKRGDEVGKLIGTWKNGQKSKTGGIGGSVDMDTAPAADTSTNNKKKLNPYLVRVALVLNKYGYDEDRLKEVLSETPEKARQEVRMMIDMWNDDKKYRAYDGEIIEEVKSLLKDGNNPASGAVVTDGSGTFAEAEAEARAQAEQVAQRTPEEQAAAQAAMQERIDREQAQREAGVEPAQRKTRRFGEEEDRLDAPLSVREYVAREIATGRATFRWDDRGDTKGLGAHTANGEAERRRRIWALNNKEGQRPEEVAERIHEMLPDALREQVTSMDLLDIINELMTEYDSPTAMWDREVRQPHAQMGSEELMPGYEEYDTQARMAWEAEKNGMSVEDWQSYNEYVSEQVSSLPAQEEIDNEITLNVNNYGDRRTETEVPAVDAGQGAQAAGVDLGTGERGNPQGAALEREPAGAQAGLREGAPVVRQENGRRKTQNEGDNLRREQLGNQTTREERLKKALDSGVYDAEYKNLYGVHHTLYDVTPEGVAIYVDDNGAPSIFLMADEEGSSFVGVFRDKTGKWTSKMQNTSGNKEVFKRQISSVMRMLPQDAQFYEHSSVSVDGLRVFAQQLKHGFERSGETYQTGLNAEDLSNVLGEAYRGDGSYSSVSWNRNDIEHLRDLLEPYMNALGMSREDVNIGRGGSQRGKVTLTLPVLQKKNSESDNSLTTGSQNTEGNNNTITLDNEVRLSNEVDENGRQFVLSKNGNIEFGRIERETGLTPAPILLSEGMITNQTTKDGYGLVHIEARHGEQIRNAGYASVIDFIEDVAKNYDVIKEGNVREGRQTYRLQLTDKHNNTLMVELSSDGAYWNINTAGIFKTSYGAKNREIYNRHTTAKQPTEAAEASRTDEQSGNQSAPRMNAPISADKSNAFVGEKQENNQEKPTISAKNPNVGEFSDEEVRELVNGFKQEIQKRYKEKKREAVRSRKDFLASLADASDAELNEIYDMAISAKEIEDAASELEKSLLSGEISHSDEDWQMVDKGVDAISSAYAMRDFIKEIETERIRRGLQQPSAEQNPSGNRMVSDGRYKELLRMMRRKLGGQLNVGVDPELLAIGTEMAVYHIEKGARKFLAYAKGMIADIGDVVRPYLKAFYNGARDLPGMEEYVKEMTPYEEVSKIDVSAIGKQPTMMGRVEQVAREQEVQAQVEEVKKKSSSRKKQQKQSGPVQGDLFGGSEESDIVQRFYVENEGDMLQLRHERIMPNGVPVTDARPIARAGSAQEMLDIINNPANRFGKELDNVRKALELEIGATKTYMDNQGNPVDVSGKLIVERIGSIDELTDEDFTNPTRSVELPKLPQNVDAAIGADGRPVIIKKNIFEKNWGSHKFSTQESRRILRDALYNTDLYGRTQPNAKPNNWVVIKIDEKSPITVLEVNSNKDNVEVVGWYTLDERNLERIRRQAERNGSELVVLSPNDKVESFPTPTPSLSSEGKGTESVANMQASEQENNEKDVSLQGRTDEQGGTRRTAPMVDFSDEVKRQMLDALEKGEKPFRSIVELRKLARECGMEVSDEGRDDILIQELVEDGLVKAGRELAEKARRDAVFKRGSSFFPQELFEQICRLYDMQPTIGQRSSNRIKMQQYSTPLPMSLVADMFVDEKGKIAGNETILEPTAGNGMLVFAVPSGKLHVNELDKVRYRNLLRHGEYLEVTKQDATQPFEGGRKYKGILSNPPFGKAEPKLYDGTEIASLEAQIALNALESMKDDGRAAIIVGGNMEYQPNGAIKGADRAFYAYLYDHYNVKGVVDMDGGLYRKQGTTYPTRMILIEGRRSEEERAQERVYPPVREKATPKAESFDALYDIVNELLNSKEKTNGTAVLRREQGLGPDPESRPGNGDNGPHHQQSPKDDRESSRGGRGGTQLSGGEGKSRTAVLGERGRDTGTGGAGRGTSETGRGEEPNAGRGVLAQNDKRVGDGAPGRRGVGLKPVERKRSLTDEKTAYRPHSGAFSLESVAPAAMTDAMDDALRRIEAEVGDIDTFVQNELGYDSTEALHNALAAEQVDSVAMAIYQMMHGEAMIIGDQTGVGKGRQMAALIRWAVKRGKKPVFITQKADLFSDLYRDLVDIGSGELRPFIFNQDGDIKDAQNQTVYKPLSDTKMKKVLQGDTLPEGYDYVVLTYSQLNKGDTQSKLEAYEQAKKSGKRVQKRKGEDINASSPKPDFLRKLAKGNILLLDESHTAAGDGNTGMYLQSITRDVEAATFASATFAKRPDTMPLYAIRTAMSKANVEAVKLIEIIEKGGVTLQEIMSRALSAVGQMVRRERDMSDVKTDWKTVDDAATVERARSNYDRTVKAFNAIIQFQNNFVKPYIEELSAQMSYQMKSAEQRRGTKDLGLTNVPFASKAYNYTKQLLLALKVDAIVDEVEQEIKAGRHPVIALESTMESVLDGYNAGDVLDNATFGASLIKGLENTLSYTVKDEKNREEKHKIPLSMLPESARQAYEEVKQLIMESTRDVYVSPIDDIISKLNARGYSVGELTGRDKYVSMEDGKAVVRKRADKDKKRMTMEFNAGKTDVLILNKSASTGISLHASSRFSDQRQRTMVMAQPLSDINDYMQMIGRIDRTGQVHRGYYINLGLPVPAENRFMMMLSTKLKSLNANTTTSQDSKQNDVEAPDLLNKYGSQVVVEYLRDHPDVYEKMGSPLKLKENQTLEDYKPEEDDARKVTGYVALLSVQEQEAFYNEVVERYNTLINQLNETDSNDLRISVMPLKAKTLSRKVATKGNDSEGMNPFARDSYVEEVEMDVLRKPWKIAEVKKQFDALQHGVAPGERVRQLLSQLVEEARKRQDAENARHEAALTGLDKEVEVRTDKIRNQKKLSEEEKKKAIEEERQKLLDKLNNTHEKNLRVIDDQVNKMRSALTRFSAGRSYLIPDVLGADAFTCSTPGMLLGFKTKEEGMTPSTSFAVFAVLDGRRKVEVKLSDTRALDAIYRHTVQNYDRASELTTDNWDSQIPQTTRTKGFILTGNIIQAVSDSQGREGGFAGKLVSYTDENGDIHDGILMPQAWTPSLMKSAGTPINAVQRRIEDGDEVKSIDGDVSMKRRSRWSSDFALRVPKSRKKGGKYFLNEELLKLVDRDGFIQRGDSMVAHVDEKQLKQVLDILSQLGVRVNDAEEQEEGGVKMQRVTGSSLVADEEADREIRDVLVERLSDAGIEVVMDAEEGQRMLDEANGGARMQAKKRALETAYSSRGEGSLTVISSADGANTGAATIAGTDSANPATGTPSLKDGANIANNLEIVANSYEKSSNRTRGFITDLSRALGLMQYGSSNYGSFNLPNGSVLTIRISNHNAKVSNFDANDELNGLSIVISKHKNKSLVNDGNAHVTEYFYPKRELESSKGKPLAGIARSINEALKTGEFTDTTGLAERQEVNGNDIRYFRRGNGEVYGFVKGGRIYLDPERVNAETPIHEYAHLWASAMRRMNPKEWANIVELMKESPVWDEVKRYYPELESDEEIADEVLATYSGRLGAEKLRDMQREVMAEKGKSLVEKVHAVAALERVKDALKRFWKGVSEFFNLHYTSAEEVADRVLYDLLDGVNPLDYGRESLESVNRRFNEELKSYMSGMMATNEMLHLGNPHGVMQIFMPNLPIVMRQRILNKGSVKKHNVDVSSLTDMPKYLSNPIFVFQRNDNTLGVLTEMQDRDGKSVCVAIELDRKIQDGGEILEVNDVRSIHGRDVADIVYPIVQNGTLRWVDKKKGLDYLSSASQYVQQEIDKQALDSAAKVVENFENPSVEGENISDEEDLLFRVREEEAPKRTGVGYKVFVLKGGQLYPPMVANPNGAATPVGVWLDADAAPVAGESKTGRKQVKAGGKGTQGGSGKLAYRPGWHLGEIPYALQFNRLNPETGEKELFPKDFVWAEVEYADDVDYQEEAMSYGYNANGKFQHSLAGLPKLPVNGSYKYRTNPNPETDEWVITGAMKVNRILKPSEVDEMVREAGREPQKRQEGAVTDADVEKLNEQLMGDVMREGERGAVGDVDAETISFENDPISKWMGVSRYSPRERKAYAQRVRRQMREQVMQMGKAMGVEIDIVESSSELSGRRARAKGWYDRRTGRVTVVLGNHGSVQDIMKTVLHEAVAHYGLRKLFGDHFDDFLDNVFANASVEVRHEIMKLAGKHGYNFRTATEEYMARLAEEDDVTDINNWWGKVKTFFLRMLAKAGVQLGVQLTDNELKYILWRSYQNLANPGRYRSVIDEVKDVAMQAKLEARSQSRESKELRRLLATGRVDMSRMAAEEDGDLYREVEDIASDFAREHKGAAECVAIRSVEDLERYIHENGYHERPVTEDGYNILDSLYNAFEKANACYDSIQGKVLMFATEDSENAQNTYLWHENVHRAVRELGLSDEDIDAVYQEINRTSPKKCEKIRSVYSEEDYKEEVIAIWINSFYNVSGDEGLLSKINQFEGDGKNVLLSIYNFVKYGTRNQQESRGNVEGRGLGTGHVVQMRNTKSASSVQKGRLRYSSKQASQGFANGQQGQQGQAGAVVDQLKKAEAAREYDRVTRSLSYHAQEAFQDCMLGLKKLQDILANASGKAVQDYENAYMYENHLSSINGAEAEVYRKHFYEPMIEAMGRLMSKDVSEQEVYDYLMKKHAIERNREMAVREKLQGDKKSYKQKMENWAAARDAIRQQSGLSWAEQQKKLDDLARSYGANIDKDYSGLDEIYSTIPSYKDKKASAIKEVEDMETKHGAETQELLDRIHKATQASLIKQRECGLMSKETFDQISSMYEYYIPLRGFEETTSEEMYDYVGMHKSGFNPVLKKAKGRTSKADNPIAYIGSMAESSIAQGNRNLMKQRFLMFVKNRPSDLVSVGELWLENDPQEGWIVKNPIIPENASPSAVQNIMEQFNEAMEADQMQYPDKYAKASQRPDIPYRTLKENLRQHQVIVKVNGKPVVITINGNPRAAQAVNGMMNPTANINPLFRRFESMNRWAAANFTRNNPSFIAVNLVRDAIYSNSMMMVKESPKYAFDYAKNWAKTEAQIYGLVLRYKNGTLDMNNETDKMFHDFIMNGGETGYNFVHGADELKGEISKKLKSSRGNAAAKTLAAVNEAVDTVNRWAEDVSRFAAYRTSIEHGRSIIRSIDDAKEVSVNFNRKGAGMKSGGSLGSLAQYCRSSYIFFNAGVQGMNNFIKAGKQHPVKFAALGMAMMSIGAFIPMLNAALFAACGGDDDDYWNIPEYVRRSNICFMFPGGKYITIPLPIELRAIYGIGEMATSVFFGKEEFSGMKLAQQVSQILPVDFLEGKGDNILINLLPTYLKPAYEVYANESWTGLPIYKDSPHMDKRPSWTRAYKGTSPQLVDLCKTLSAATGGVDDIKRGWLELNPAMIEHLFQGYFGGVGKTINQSINSVNAIFNEDMREVNNIPVVYRFYKEANERTRNSAINRRFIEMENRYLEIRRIAKNYLNRATDMKLDESERNEYRERFIQFAEENDLQKMRKFFEYKKMIRKMEDYLKEDLKNEEVENQYYMLKHQMLDEFN